MFTIDQDLREKYKDWYWRPGVLNTCACFAHYLISDQNRTGVYIFDTPKKCREAVEQHNKEVKLQRLLLNKGEYYG